MQERIVQFDGMQRKRININVYDGITDAEALAMVNRVVAGGRISGNGTCYCYCAVNDRNGIQCFAEHNSTGSDSFHVSRTAAHND